MKATLSVLAFVAGGLAAVIPSHEAGAQSGTPTEFRALYDDAVKEGGTLTLYSQIVPTTLEALGRQWSQRFPNVKLNYVRLTTAPMIERVNAEFSSGRPLADVVMVSDAVWPEDLFQAGRIAEYQIDSYKSWPAAYKRDNYYFVSQLYLSAVLYNTRKVSAADAPKSYRDVLKFGKQATIADPRAGGGNASIMFGTMQQFGDSFWKEAAAAQVQYSASVAQATPLVVSGDMVASIHTHSFPACEESEGKPVKTVYPAEGVWSTTAVSFGTKGAAHPKAAHLFLAYMMSEEGQNFINVRDCTYSVRPGVKLNAALPPLSSLKVIDITADQWRKQGADYRKAASAAAGVPLN
jgi:iron(III) transport system substrate-binding protein